MFASWKTFVHPAKAYRLEYPAHWDQVQQDEARTCGFGPHERDDVGLWISIMPMSVDTERLVDDLPKVMEKLIEEETAVNIRRDNSLKTFGLKADMVKDGDAGNYWILAGGDILLFASTQVPAAERDVWNPPFERLMASIQITRAAGLMMRQVANEVLAQLRERYPDQEFEFDEKGIRGKNRTVYLGNLYREVKGSPKARDKIIKNFVEGLSQSVQEDMGYEVWDEVRGMILPILKTRDFIVPGTSTQHLTIREWLLDVVICYVIKQKKFYRFLTGWDLRRWEITQDFVHECALENLKSASWPHRLEGVRDPSGGRVIVVTTPDGLASSRILSPEFHKLFSSALGSPFLAGIPNRETLVTFSNRRVLKKRIGRQLAKDCRSSAYPITSRPFLVTADGIAPAGEGP